MDLDSADHSHPIGVHTVLGPPIAGVLGRRVRPILTRHIDEQLRGLIVSLFMPVLFGLSGLSADLWEEHRPFPPPLTGALDPHRQHR